MNCEKDELLKEQLELFEKLDVLEEKIHDEERRLEGMFYDRRNELNAQEERLKKEEENLSFKKMQIESEEQSTRELLKKLWGIWIFWIVLAIIAALVSVFFVHGYLASDNRALNTYNKALSSYNEKISDLDTKIYKKNESLKDKYEDLETQYCGTENEWVNLCIGTNEDIERLSDSIEELEQQKKELVKPQEPTL